MNRRYLLAAVVVGAVLITMQLMVSWPAGSQPVKRVAIRTQSAAYREAIRAMPLLERPNRPGHFYGNTVRWLNGRRNG